MDAKAYASEACLYYKKSGSSQQKTLVSRHFPRACEAIRFAVEDLDPRVLQGCSLEVDDAHYFGREIQPLYDDCAFPLRRSAKKGVRRGAALQNRTGRSR